MAVAEAITLPFTLTVVVTRLLETSPERAPPAVVVTLISPVFDSSPIFDLVSEEGDPWAASIVRIVSLRDKSTCGESSFFATTRLQDAAIVTRETGNTEARIETACAVTRTHLGATGHRFVVTIDPPPPRFTNTASEVT
jgi:hypothetical protein